MRDTAALAAMSAPSCNYHFRRGWTDPPPLKSRRPDPAQVEPFDFGNNNISGNSKFEATAARACDAAARRIESLELRANVLHAIGLRDAALRFRALAAAIREAVLA